MARGRDQDSQGLEGEPPLNPIRIRAEFDTEGWIPAQSPMRSPAELYTGPRRVRCAIVANPLTPRTFFGPHISLTHNGLISRLNSLPIGADTRVFRGWRRDPRDRQPSSHPGTYICSWLGVYMRAWPGCRRLFRRLGSTQSSIRPTWSPVGWAWVHAPFRGRAPGANCSLMAAQEPSPAATPPGPRLGNTWPTSRIVRPSNVADEE